MACKEEGSDSPYSPLGQEDGALPDGITPGEDAGLKFCPLTSNNAEQSFSVYINIISDQHHTFSETTLSRVAVTNLFCERLNSEEEADRTST